MSDFYKMTFYDFLHDACHHKNISKYLQIYDNLDTSEICLFIKGGVRVCVLKQILDTKKDKITENDIEDFFEWAVMCDKFFLLRYLKKRFYNFFPTKLRQLFFYAFVENKNWEIVLFLEENFKVFLIHQISSFFLKNLPIYKKYKDFILKRRVL